jgi:hypothetical protein
MTESGEGGGGSVILEVRAHGLRGGTRLGHGDAGGRRLDLRSMGGRWGVSRSRSSVARVGLSAAQGCALGVWGAWFGASLTRSLGWFVGSRR